MLHSLAYQCQASKAPTKGRSLSKEDTECQLTLLQEFQCSKCISPVLEKVPAKQKEKSRKVKMCETRNTRIIEFKNLQDNRGGYYFIFSWL